MTLCGTVRRFGPSWVRTGLMLTLVLGACSGDSDPERAGTNTAPTCCEPGPPSCFGGQKWVCASDGSEWTDKDVCSGLKSCVDGECVASVCMPAGDRECLDESTGTVCSADKMTKTEFTCGDGEVCDEGVCVSDACSADETQCGFQVVFGCQNGDWKATDCSPGELCVSDAEGARCEAWACEPGRSWCDGAAAVMCDAEGRAETRTACSESQACEDGFCVAAACVPAGASATSSSDAGATEDAMAAVNSGDTAGAVDQGDGSGPADVEPEPPPPAPALEKTSKVEFKLGGIPNLFDINAQADYQESESRLVIKANGPEGRIIEINVGKVELYALGTWADYEVSEVGVKVCYADGTAQAPLPEELGCAVGFTHASSLYDLQLTDNNGPGSYLAGTFSVKLVDGSMNPLEFTEGTFDVLHK